MWGLLPLLLIPVIIMVCFRSFSRDGHYKFTVFEFVALECVMALLLGGGFVLAQGASMWDTEYWSGRVTKKIADTQHCCHCHDVCTGHNAKGQCTSHTEVCSHSHDYRWDLQLSTGDKVEIESCSGFNNPPADWTNAKVGDAAVAPHLFYNYLLADPETLVRKSTSVQGTAPKYPNLHNHYKLERAINLGTQMNPAQWSRGLDEILADIGKPKKVNIVVVATTNPNPEYAEVVERDWLYGKLNDAIFVLGAPDGVNIAWAQVVTLPGANNMLKVNARDALIGQTLSDPTVPLATIQNLVVQDWVWTGNEEYSYLKWSAQPSTFSTVLLYLAAILISVIGSLFALNNDIHDWK